MNVSRLLGVGMLLCALCLGFSTMAATAGQDTAKGTGTAAADLLLGKWKLEKEEAGKKFEMVMEFKKGGAASMTIALDGKTLVTESAAYKLSNDGKSLEIAPKDTGKGKAEAATVISLTAEQLVIEGKSGGGNVEKMTFKRVK